MFLRDEDGVAHLQPIHEVIKRDGGGFNHRHLLVLLLDVDNLIIGILMPVMIPVCLRVVRWLGCVERLHGHQRLEKGGIQPDAG